MGAQGGALNLTATTSSTQSDFPEISAQQYATLERVVAACPAGAKDWAAFEATYEQLGIDEEEYYPLCLKLSLERGLDWRSKWATVKASYEQRGIALPAEDKQQVQHGHARTRSAGGFDLLKARVDQITSASPRRAPSAPPPSSTTPRPSAVSSRSRVDSPQAPTPRTVRPTRTFLVETANGHSSSDDYVGVPSPAPRSSRPREESTAPILPPPRPNTSSLLAGQARREKHSSLPPFPSSSPAPLHARFAESVATPRIPSMHPLLDKYINSATHSKPAASSLPTVALRTKSEIIADDFRRSSLLTDPWYTWRKRLGVLRTRQANLDAARRVVLSRWAINRWRQKLARAQELQRKLGMVLQAKEDALLRGGFSTWKAKVEDRHRQEWEAGLRSAWEVVRSKWKDKARKQCFQHWRQAALEAKARRFRTESLLGFAVAHWFQKHQQLVHSDRQAAALFSQHQSRAKAIIVSNWRYKAELVAIERSIVEKQEARMLWDCWEYWKWRTRQEQNRRRLEEIAIRFHADKERRRIIIAWRRRLQDVESLDTPCDIFIARQSQKLRQHYHHLWLTAWSGRLLHHSRSLRLLQSSLTAWTERYYTIAIDLDAKCTALVSHGSRKLLEGSWDQWRAATAQKAEMARSAEDVYATSLARRTLARWRERLSARDVDERKAAVAREFFQQRGAWNRWVERNAERKRTRWLEERVVRRKKEVLLFWLAKTRQAKADRAVVEAFQAALDARIVSDALATWTKRIVDVRARALDANAMYEAQLTKTAWDKWTSRCNAVVDLYDLADSFVVVKAEEQQSRTLRHWRAVVRRNREHRRLLAELQEKKEHTLKEEAFGNWREKSLRGVEEQVVSMRRKRETEEMLAEWVERSQYLHAIQTMKENKLRRLFDHWREFTPHPDLVDRALQWKFGIVAGRSFQVWSIKQQARSAVRAASRYRSVNSTPNSSFTAPAFRASTSTASAAGSGSGSGGRTSLGLSSPSRSSFPSITAQYAVPTPPASSSSPPKSTSVLAPASPSPFRSRLLSSTSNPSSPAIAASSSTPPLGLGGSSSAFKASRSLDGGDGRSSNGGSARDAGVDALRARLRAAAMARRETEGR